MKPEHIARLRSIQTLLKDVREEIDHILGESDFQEAEHVDEKQDEVDTFEAEMPIESLTAGMEGDRVQGEVTVGTW